MQLSAPRAAVVLALLSLWVPHSSSADETTGTWTGGVGLRGNYYYEKSTRVVAPETEVELESPKGVRVRAKYLVDSITSASIAAGTLEDTRFREIRHDMTVGGGYEFDLGDKQLDVDGSVRVSREPDYTSFSTSIATALSLNQRSTVLHGTVSILHDEVRQKFRGGFGIRPMNMGGTAASSFSEDFDALTIGASWEQVVNRYWLFQCGYDYGWLSGFLANAYRSVAGGQRPETHPQKRRRHTLSARSAWFIPKSKTSLQLLYRNYIDSWDIAAYNPEVRIYQEILPYLQVRVHYAYYRQTASFFYEADQTQYTDEDLYVTADPKMSAFRVHSTGFQLRIAAEFLSNTKLSKFSESAIDLSFDRLWSTSAFGNGVIAIAGVWIPF